MAYGPIIIFYFVAQNKKQANPFNACVLIEFINACIWWCKNVDRSYICWLEADEHM